MPKVRKTPRTRQLAIDAGIVALIALGIFAVVYRVWNADLGVPFVYIEKPGNSPLAWAPDAPFYLMLVKGAIDHGWFLNNPSLGAPFGQALHEFPQGLDNLNLLVLQVLGWITRDPFVAVNLFLVLTFIGVAVSSYLVARRLGCSRVAGAVVALLYTFLPYHTARGSAHLLLSAYWLVPVAALLLIQITSRSAPFTADADTPRGWKVSLRARSSWWWLVGCAGLASTGSYYAAITMTLVAVVMLIDFLARRETRVLASGAIAIAAILAVCVLNLVPTFLYWADHGRNADLVKRGPSETEVQGLKISQLVLPVPYYRIPAFAEMQADSTRFSVLDSERGQQLGAIGAAGFLGMLVVLLVTVLRRGRSDDPPSPAVEADGGGVGWDPPAPPLDVVRIFGVATVAGLLIAAVSGFSLVVSGLGLKEIRSWNRISVFIGFFALVTVGFGIDWIRRRWVRRRLPNRPWRLAATVALAGGLVLVGVLDQVSARIVPNYQASAEQFDSDQTFFSRVERTLPAGAAVFNLPYIFFPESGIVRGVGPYDTARGFLHTDDVRWSWGGVIGTDADWAAGAAQSDPEEMLDRVVAMGFHGLVLDRRADAGPLREVGITLLAGEPAFVSPDGTLAFFDLRPYARDARMRLGPSGLRAKRDAALADRGSPRGFG